MVTIKTFPTPLEAEQAKLELEAAGIPGLVLGVGIAMEGGIAGVKLQVPDDRVDEALAVLGDG